MDSIKSAGYSIKNLISSRIEQALSSKPAPLKEFPQFPKLPVEIRFRIWQLALERRIQRVEIRKYDAEVR